MRRLPPLKALRAFEAAARHMSFKAAADELGLTPTAVSHQIRLLETVLGGSLFRRRPRPLTLTPPGAALFPVVRSGFDAIAEAFATVHSEVVPLRLEATAAPAGMSRRQAPSDQVGGKPHAALAHSGGRHLEPMSVSKLIAHGKRVRSQPGGGSIYVLFRGRPQAVIFQDRGSGAFEKNSD